MANDQPIIITGNLAGDPELRFNPSGSAVANFTIIFNPRRFDKNSNSWVKGEPISWRCEAWNQGQLSRAENICNMLKRGDSVVAIGVLETKTWTTKENEPRSRVQVKIDSIGKDLTFHGQAYQQNEAPPANQQSQGWGGNQPAAQDDPWATPAAANNGGGWGGGPGNEPPF
ncbi:ssDNA binding protein [Arthrobacter phage EvePickles]|nr:ssDNA binding protein [Arthrobacter phage EvePickles]